MGWKAFTVRLKPAGPMAVGPGWRLGFVALTRLDVPARTLWGAFTDALTRSAANGSVPDKNLCFINGENPYFSIGKWVRKHVRFLPGVYGIDSDNKFIRLLPWYEFGAGPMFRIDREFEGLNTLEPADRISRLLVNGAASTALDYADMAAEDSMLHETERIQPRVRLNGGICPVYLETVVFLSAEACSFMKEWIEKKAVACLRIGRDAAAGDGVFERIDISEITDWGEIIKARQLNVEQKAVWESDKTDGPLLTLSAEGTADNKNLPAVRLPGPFVWSEGSNDFAGYWGDLRPHIVREFDRDKGFGRKIGQPEDHAGKAPEARMWMLDHGGVLALNNTVVKARFVLKRDGWEASD